MEPFGASQAVLAVLLSITFPAALAVALYGHFLLRWRGLEAKAAADLLSDWDMQLELLDETERARARLDPPWNVVQALVNRR